MRDGTYLGVANAVDDGWHLLMGEERGSGAENDDNDVWQKEGVE